VKSAGGHDVPVATARDGMIGAGYPPEHSDGLLVYFAAVKAGKLFVQPTVKQLLGSSWSQL